MICGAPAAGEKCRWLLAGLAIPASRGSKAIGRAVDRRQVKRLQSTQLKLFQPEQRLGFTAENHIGALLVRKETLAVLQAVEQARFHERLGLLE